MIYDQSLITTINNRRTEMNIMRRPKMPEIEKLENEIGELIQSKPFSIPAPMYAPAPPATAQDLGRITAEAIKQAHDAATTSLEMLGEAIVERVNEIEKLKAQSMKELEEIKELIDAYRDGGKRMALEVESAGNDLNAAREMIAAMREKIKG